MKNGYTPKEFAHTIAIDALGDAITAASNGTYDLTDKEVEHAVDQMRKLRQRLADKTKLDILFV
jgi:hypothetical protein